MCDNIILDE